MGGQFKDASAQNGCRAIHLLLEKTTGCQVPLNIHPSIRPSIHPSIYLSLYLSISLQDPPNRGGRRHQGASPFYLDLQKKTNMKDKPSCWRVEHTQTHRVSSCLSCNWVRQVQDFRLTSWPDLRHLAPPVLLKLHISPAIPIPFCSWNHVMVPNSFGGSRQRCVEHALNGFNVWTYPTKNAQNGWESKRQRENAINWHEETFFRIRW